MVAMTAINKSQTTKMSRFLTNKVCCCLKTQPKRNSKSSLLNANDLDESDTIHTDSDIEKEETPEGVKEGARTVLGAQNEKGSKFIVDGAIKDAEFKALY